jgi:hypothetical protein
MAQPLSWNERAIAGLRVILHQRLSRPIIEAFADRQVYRFRFSGPRR